METVILLLLLALSDKNNGNMKESLNRFLGFYKENRDLIQMLSNTFSRPNGENAPASVPEEKHEESRPREEIGNLNILEEYLRRANA